MGVDSITELYQGIPVEGPEFSDAAAYVGGRRAAGDLLGISAGGSSLREH